MTGNRFATALLCFALAASPAFGQKRSNRRTPNTTATPPPPPVDPVPQSSGPPPDQDTDRTTDFLLPALPTPHAQTISAPPPAPLELDHDEALPQTLISPAVRFAVAWDPVVITDTDTALARGALEGAFILRKGRLHLDLALGGHVLKEAGTPIAMRPGFGADVAAGYDVFERGALFVRLGGNGTFSSASGSFLAPYSDPTVAAPPGSASFLFHYTWFDVEADGGLGYRRGGLELCLSAAARYVTGSVVAPTPIGRESIQTGGLRSQFKLANSGIGPGARASATWYFRLTPGSHWGGMVIARASALPYGGDLAVGAWF